MLDLDAQQEDNVIAETSKPVALKLLEEYDESSSDNEPPEETIIIKESALSNDTILIKNNEEQCSTSKIEDISLENSNEVDSTSLSVLNDNKVLNTEVKIENSSKINGDCGKQGSEQGQKRKRSPKKDFKPVKKTPPLRTPRTEVVERKGALLEAVRIVILVC